MSGLISVAEQQRALRIRRWLPPDVSIRVGPEVEPEAIAPPPPPPTPEEIAAIKEAARQEGLELGYREGYESGYRAGRQQAEQEAEAERAERAAREQAWRAYEEQRLTETVAALEGIARALADPLAESIEVLEPELLSLVAALARRVVMAELSIQPELIQRVLDEALKQLPSRNHPVRVQVNPEDQAILESYAKAHDERIAWIPDPNIERGGCVVLSGPSRIDASLETRLRQGIEALWGELIPPELSGAERDREGYSKPDPGPLGQTGAGAPADELGEVSGGQDAQVQGGLEDEDLGPPPRPGLMETAARGRR